jgi:hypothetical protein
MGQEAQVSLDFKYLFHSSHVKIYVTNRVTDGKINPAYDDLLGSVSNLRLKEANIYTFCTLQCLSLLTDELTASDGIGEQTDKMAVLYISSVTMVLSRQATSAVFDTVQ